MTRLQGKAIVVTGASKGIGRAIALGAAREGADVFVNYNSGAQDAAGVVAEIVAMGRRAWPVQASIRDIEDIRRMFRFVAGEVPALHALVNNAGITGWTPLLETTVEKWDLVMETNLRGTFFCSLEAARLMKETGGGAIVNVSTNCAALGVKNLVAYAASKGGIHALTRQLAVELAPHKIRVNTFAPGPTNVDRNLADDPEYGTTWGSMVPMQRTAEPGEMSATAVYLMSGDSSYMTGQVFYVDGGWSVQGRIPEANMDRAARRNA